MGAQCCAPEHPPEQLPPNLELTKINPGPSPHDAAPFQIPTLNNNIRQLLSKLDPVPVEENCERGTKLKAFQFIKTGNIYHGQWEGPYPHGRGEMYFSDQSYLEGHFVHGKLNGKGRYFFANGNYYQGDIKNGVAQGIGKLTQLSPPSTYKGQISNNQPHGYGVYESDEQKFQGTYNHGQKQNGVYIWGQKQEFKYQGSFVNQLFEGEGTLISPIGVYKGKFQQGKKHGKGVFIWNQGNKYQGDYVQDLKSGYGVTYDRNGEKIYEGNWFNDQPNGEGSLFVSGVQTHGYWQNSILKYQLAK